MITVVNTAFDRAKDADFENMSLNVATQLANKAIFTPPFAELEALTAAVKTYSDALAQSFDRGRVAIAKKNAARKALGKLLKKAALYVSLVAGEDESIIIGAGFRVKKPRGSRPAVTAPQNIQVESGTNTGEVLISVDAVADAKTYFFEYAVDQDLEKNAWVSELDSRCVHLVRGLKPGQKYWFRVAAVGLRGAKAYSNVIAVFAQ